MLKVYSKDGDLLASTNEEAVAACIVSTFGDEGGWVSEDIKSRVLWVEGEDGEAISSYDTFSDFIANVRANLPETLPLSSHWVEKSSRYGYAYRKARELAHSGI